MIKILIADDDLSILELIQDVLEETKRYEVRAVADGADAYACLPDFKPDVIITDVRMPKMSGTELVEKIRESDKVIPIAVISGYPDQAAELLEVGANMWLDKPFKDAELLEGVENLVSPKQA